MIILTVNSKSKSRIASHLVCTLLKENTFILSPTAGATPCRVSRAHDGVLEVYRFTPVGGDSGNALQFVQSCREAVRSILTEKPSDPNRLIRAQLRLNLHMRRVKGEDVVSEEDKWISSCLEELEGEHVFDSWWDKQSSACERIIDCMNTNGSGWTLSCANMLDVCIANGDKIRYYVGRSDSFVLPEALKHKKAVINPPSDGQNCFLYACLAVIHHGSESLRKAPHRRSTYRPWLQDLNLTGVEMPVGLHNLAAVEKQNENFCFSVLTWQGGKVEVLRQPTAKLASGRRIISLLYLPNNSSSTNLESEEPVSDGSSIENDSQRGHWCGIVHLDRLLNSKHGLYQRKWCERCLSAFHSMERLEQHRQDCYQSDDFVVRELMPSSDSNMLLFKSWEKTVSPPFVAYADIEAFNSPCEQTAGDNRVLLTEHQPAAAGYAIVQRTGTAGPQLFTADNGLKIFQNGESESCIEKFLKSLEQTAKCVYQWNKIYSYQPKLKDSESNKAFNESSACHYCKVGFSDQNSKNWDHDHLTGEFKGASCSDCNLRAQLRRRFLPVFFHNLAGYDMHLLFTTALRRMKGWKLSVVPHSMERYLSLRAEMVVDIVEFNGRQRPIFFTIQFLDSLQFLNCSLQSLMSNMALDECKSTMQMKKGFPLLTDEVLLAKGVFPYDFLRTKNDLLVAALPSQSDFFNTLTKSECCDEDYERAKQAWREFQANNLGDYMLAYLELDIRQLADIFESFRRLSLEDDGLDPVHYISTPGLSFDSALKTTGAKLELLTDVDMHRMFERGIRGGITFVNVHHVEAQSSSGAASAETSTADLIPLDVNNLYGVALSMALPVRGFRWVESSTLEFWTEDAILNLEDDSSQAFLLEVDLIYPDSIHKRTEELPLAPEKGKIEFDLFPEFMKELWQQLHPDATSYHPCQKLLLTCFDKERYVVHSKILKFYLQQGMKIGKFHRAIEFQQEKVFEPYILKNSERRSQANSDFEKNYYKLKNNSLFGKTMENVRKRRDIRICTDAHQAKVLASKPNLKDFIIINEDISIFQLAKGSIKLNRPIYVGQCVLDHSKFVMYSLFYCQLKSRFEANPNSKVRLCGGDTDSLFLCMENLDVENIVLPEMIKAGLLDTSNYPDNHALKSNQLKAKLGCLKNEAAGEKFTEWILLRPKLYSMLAEGRHSKISKKVAKGVQKCVVKQEISHQDYWQAFHCLQELTVHVRRIGSLKHRVFTMDQSKRALTAWEDKRAWIDSNESLPFGHCALRSSSSQARSLKRQQHETPTLSSAKQAKDS